MKKMLLLPLMMGAAATVGDAAPPAVAGAVHERAAVGYLVDQGSTRKGMRCGYRIQGEGVANVPPQERKCPVVMMFRIGAGQSPTVAPNGVVPLGRVRQA